MQLLPLTSLQFQGLRDGFQAETGEPLTVHTLADAKHVPNVASALCTATQRVISHQDVWEWQKAAVARTEKLHPEKHAADLAHRAAVKMSMPRDGVFLPDIASLDLASATPETIVNFIRGALNSQADNIGDIACLLRTKIAREFSSDFKRSLEINQCIAEALLVLYPEFPQFAWLNEVIFFADAGHSQRMSDNKEKVGLHDDWKKIQDPFWRARCEWLAWSSETSGDMPMAWRAEKRALSARNVYIDLFFGDEQGEEVVRQETQKARCVIIQNLHEAVTLYMKAGNLPAARRCLYLLARHEGRGKKHIRRIFDLFTEAESADQSVSLWNDDVISPRALLIEFALGYFMEGDYSKAQAALGRYHLGPQDQAWLLDFAEGLWMGDYGSLLGAGALVFCHVISLREADFDFSEVCSEEAALAFAEKFESDGKRLEAAGLYELLALGYFPMLTPEEEEIKTLKSVLQKWLVDSESERMWFEQERQRKLMQYGPKAVHLFERVQYPEEASILRNQMPVP